MYIDKDTLATKLNILKQAIPTKQDNGIKGVLYKDGCLFATNMEIGIKTPLPQDKDECFIIPAKAIDLIEKLPDGPLEIIPKNTDRDYQITIKAPGITNKFKSYSPILYPEFEKIIDTNKVAIQSIKFAEAVKAVMYAADNKNFARVYSGINFQSENGQLNIVATDSHRLSWYTLANYPMPISITVPKQSLQKILKMPLGDEILIAYNKGNAIFESGQYIFYTRLLEGKWPEYQKLFKEKNITTTANRAELLLALERCESCADEKDSTAMTLNFEKDNLTLTSNSQAVEYSEVFKLDEPVQEAIKIGFNGSYLIEALKSYKDHSINILLSGSVEPVILFQGTLKTLVLPLRLF